MGQCFTGVDGKTEHVFFIATSKAHIIMCQYKGTNQEWL